MTTKKCINCGEEKPLSEYHKSGLDAYGNSMFKSKCKVCVSIEALRAKAAPDVSILMREAAQMANQAFPILSPEFWNTGADKRVCEELGL